jgi:hypothetical protein
VGIDLPKRTGGLQSVFYGQAVLLGTIYGRVRIGSSRMLEGCAEISAFRLLKDELTVQGWRGSFA